MHTYLIFGQIRALKSKYQYMIYIGTVPGAAAGNKCISMYTTSLYSPIALVKMVPSDMTALLLTSNLRALQVDNTIYTMLSKDELVDVDVDIREWLLSCYM